ncbi:MAG TPA: DsbA family protein [Caulobacteraceae bacterium]|nr:DsbA family protein [Caulobacteraceae bacterium]
MRAVVRRSVLLAAAAFTLVACGGGGGAGKAEGDVVMGRADAPVTVVEYASVTCGHCAAWNEEVFPEFKKKYVDTGQVKYVFREFPTAPQQISTAGFLVARCAGDDKYFQVVDALMRTQSVLQQTGDARAWLLQTAQSAGLTEERFNQCVGDEKALAAFNGRVEKAVKDGISVTPTFLVDGEKVEGAQSMAQLDALIQPKLKGGK